MLFLIIAREVGYKPYIVWRPRNKNETKKQANKSKSSPSKSKYLKYSQDHKCFLRPGGSYYKTFLIVLTDYYSCNCYRVV
jgi:hypothetical protein